MLFWYFLKTRFYAAYGQWVQVLILIIQVLKLLVQVFQTDESCDRPFESLDYPPSFVKTSVSEGKELCSSYSPGGEFPPRRHRCWCHRFQISCGVVVDRRNHTGLYHRLSQNYSGFLVIPCLLPRWKPEGDFTVHSLWFNKLITKLWKYPLK